MSIIVKLDNKINILSSDITEKYNHDPNCVVINQSLKKIKESLNADKSLAYKTQNNEETAQTIHALNNLIDDVSQFVISIGSKKMLSKYLNSTTNNKKAKEFQGLIESFLPMLADIAKNTGRLSVTVASVDSISEKDLASKLEQFKSSITQNKFIVPNKTSGTSSYTYPNGDIYDGLWKKGYKNGKGIYKCQNGITYDGEFYYNDIYGLGKLLHENEIVYEGSFKYGKKDGNGRLLWFGTIYVGTFKDDKAHGKGTLSLGASSFGALYEGEFKNNMKHGKGKDLNSVGNLYIGPFSSNKYHGYGTLTTTEGKFEGYFKEGVKHGKGTMEYKSGDIFKGTFKDDFLENGTLTFAAGGKYVGSFKNNKYNSDGILMKSDGSVYKGTFSLGFFSGTGSLTMKCGSLYNGQFENDKFNGKGKLVSKTLNYEYTGTFKDGNPHGKGDIKYPDSGFYNGEMRDGLRHGNGKMRYPDNTVYEGKWVDDQRIDQLKSDGQLKPSSPFSKQRRFSVKVDEEQINQSMTDFKNSIKANGKDPIKDTTNSTQVNSNLNGQTNYSYPDGAFYEG